MTEFRNLNADEIEVRVQSVKDGKVHFLLYKDARCDMKILDETVGCYNWKREHTIKEGINYCTVSIYDENKKEWVSKEDCGAETNIDANKGASSDAFKRACFNWGIGRSLYTTPKIVIADDGYGNLGYKVSDIEYDNNRSISKLTITDRFGNIKFDWVSGSTIETPTVYRYAASEQTFEQPYQKQEPKKDNQEILKGFCTNKKLEEGINLKELTKFYDFYLTRVNKYSSCNPEVLWNRWNKNNFENKF